MDILILPMEGKRELQAILDAEFTESRPAISPDGKWMAYHSNESGQDQIYVRPFPNVDDGRWQISTDGGTSPMWAPNSRELFYRTGDAMVRVPVSTEQAFAAGTPAVLFRDTYAPEPGGTGRVHDLSPDGQRFLMIKEGGTRVDARPHIVLVQNWFEELKARMPTN